MESNLICFFYHKKNVFIIKIKVVKEVFDSTFINFKWTTAVLLHTKQNFLQKFVNLAHVDIHSTYCALHLHEFSWGTDICIVASNVICKCKIYLCFDCEQFLKISRLASKNIWR